MAVSPTPDESYYREIAQSYADAELAILAQIRARLLKGASLDTQAWATARLAELQQLRGEALATLRQVNSGASAQINSTITDAYADGGQSALFDAREYLPERPSAVTSAARRASVQAVAREVAEGTATAQSGVLRQVEDQYRAVVRSVVATVASGGMDRRAATGKALQDALGAGLKTGPDGRMSLESYVAMATRTGVAKAMIQGHLDTMAANGLDLVYIHPGPRPCDRCDGWGNQILWRTSGPAGTVTMESVTTGEPVQVQVAGSLDQARTDGWGHPNCRCSVGAYLPGATDLPKEREPWDQEGYEAQQRQREIERTIRDWKRKAALATTPEEYDRAQAKVAQWQGAMRDWMESHPALKRQYSREGGGGYRRTSTPTASPSEPTNGYTPASGVKRSRTDTLKATDWASIVAKDNKPGLWTSDRHDADGMLAEIWRQRGFDAKPQVVSKAEFDTTVANAQPDRVIYRALSGEPDEVNGWFDQLMYGDEPYAGLGYAGNGTYFATEQWWSDTFGHTRIRSALHPDARGIGEKELEFVRQEASKWAMSTGNMDAMGVVTDLGRLASVLGYDYIQGATHPEVVVLNRSALIIEDPRIK